MCQQLVRSTVKLIKYAKTFPLKLLGSTRTFAYDFPHALSHDPYFFIFTLRFRSDFFNRILHVINFWRFPF